MSDANTLVVPLKIATLLGFWVRNWLIILTLFSFLYVGLSFLAPIALALGYEDIALHIYRLYSFTCHQLPASSFWLFGEDLGFKASLDGATIPDSNLVSRDFVGNSVMGFKSGMCSRTLAIYGSLAMLLLVFMGTGRKWKALPLWTGLILVLPMAADGVSQLLGLRESNTFLRIFTGGLFSLGLAWSTLPHIETAMRSVAADLHTDQEPTRFSL